MVTQTVNYDASTASSATDAYTQSVRLVSTTNCHYVIYDSGNPVAATTSHAYLPANMPETVKIGFGQKIAAIKASGSSAGTLYITEYPYWVNPIQVSENSRELEGYNWDSPGNLGVVTPNAAKFTAMLANSGAFYGSGVTQPFTALAAATYGCTFGLLDSAQGGALFAGFRTGATALQFAGYASAPDTDSGAGGNGCVKFQARKSDGGTSFASLASTEILASFFNSSTVKAWINGDGTFTTVGDIKLPTGKNHYSDGIALGNFVWKKVTVAFSDLSSAAHKDIIAAASGDQYRVCLIRLIGGGTSFDIGGDRAVAITDGTTTWSSISAVSLKALPANSEEWGGTDIPHNGAAAGTASAVGTAIYCVYTGGATDYTSGSFTIAMLLEKIA